MCSRPGLGSSFLLEMVIGVLGLGEAASGATLLVTIVGSIDVEMRDGPRRPSVSLGPSAMLRSPRTGHAGEEGKGEGRTESTRREGKGKERREMRGSISTGYFSRSVGTGKEKTAASGWSFMTSVAPHRFPRVLLT